MPLNCSRVRLMLDEKVDARLTSREVRAIDAHLRGCPSCRDLDRSLSKLVSWVREVPFSPAPEMVGPIVRALSYRRPGRSPTPITLGGRIAWPALGAAAAAILVFILWSSGLSASRRGVDQSGTRDDFVVSTPEHTLKADPQRAPDDSDLQPKSTSAVPDATVPPSSAIAEAGSDEPSSATSLTPVAVPLGSETVAGAETSSAPAPMSSSAAPIALPDSPVTR